MLDKAFVRENLELVKRRLSERGGDYPLEELINIEADRKNAALRIEDLRRQRNEASEQIGRLKKEGRDTSEQQAQVKAISAETKALEDQSRLLEDRLNTILHGIPNLPHSSVPSGRDESANAEVRRWGATPRRQLWR